MLSAVLFASAVSVPSVVDSMVEQPERELNYGGGGWASTLQYYLSAIVSPYTKYSFTNISIPGLSASYSSYSSPFGCSQSYQAYASPISVGVGSYGRALGGSHYTSKTYPSKYPTQYPTKSYSPPKYPSTVAYPTVVAPSGYPSSGYPSSYPSKTYSKPYPSKPSYPSTGYSANALAYKLQAGSSCGANIGYSGAGSCSSCGNSYGYFAANKDEDPEALKAKYGKGEEDVNHDTLASGVAGSAFVMQLF